MRKYFLLFKLLLTRVSCLHGNWNVVEYFNKNLLEYAMFEKLKLLKNQYEELLRRMEEPSTYSDAAVYARCDREARELAPVVEAYCAYEKACADMDDALELMNDPEMRELAQEEFSAAKEAKRLILELKGA